MDGEGANTSSQEMPPLALDRRALLLWAATTSLSGSLAAQAGAAVSSGHPSGLGPHRVRDIETVWVTMSDGVKLALRIVLPENASQHPVPAIIQYWPYRRRDWVRTLDDQLFIYFASHGYACIHPDIRGTGDSEGVLRDEYLKTEQDDCLEVIDWIAKQPWCTGKVGMTGLSWSGFSALQVAARRPPALEAILVHGCADDRYTDDAHYLGGTVMQDMLVWGAMFFALQAFPPDPAVVGDRWREMWRTRCDGLNFAVADWFRHQRRDAFWQHGSIDEDYGAITCPVYAISGWADGYPNAVPRLLEHLKVPRKGLIGPWGHTFPHVSGPGPMIDYLNEALRWWDHWLKGIDTGIMDEPQYRTWMQDDAAHGGDGPDDIPGRWVAEPSWPSPHIQPSTWYLNHDGLHSVAKPEMALHLAPHQTVGITAGYWCPAGGGDHDLLRMQLPKDQRADDARSLTFDSRALAERVEFLGFPVVELDLAVDKPVALVVVRLDAVHLDGTSRQLSYGVLNLTHRNSDEHPEPLEPGRRYHIRVQLRNAGVAFSPGQRMRVAISTSYWPLVVPSPEPVHLTLFSGSCKLILPIRQPQAADEHLRAFGPAFVPPISPTTTLKADVRPTSTVETRSGVQTIINRSGGGLYRIEATRMDIGGDWLDVASIADDDPLSARVDYSNTQIFRRGDWQGTVQVKLSLKVSATDYHVRGTIVARDAGREFFTRSWDETIPRELS